MISSTILLDFDSVTGPKISKIYGENSLSENDISSLCSCAFPETTIQSDNESIFFCFKISKHYCYSMFTTKVDQDAPRGHKQYTFVIVTDFPYFYIFSRLLHSTLSLFSYSPTDIAFFLSDFLLKWEQNFMLLNDNEIIELPMFDGSQPVRKGGSIENLLDMVASMGWSPQCSIYYINDCFMGIDLQYAFSVDSLLKSKRSHDLFILWEAVIIEESILVYGSTPTIASHCVLAIESLLFPCLPNKNFSPFISVTDSRYQSITSKVPNGTVIGVSNPISVHKSCYFDRTFYTGFEKQNGFTTEKGTWTNLRKNEGEQSLRKIFYNLNLLLMRAISKCFDEMCRINPYAAYIGHVDSFILQKLLKDSGIDFSIDISLFTKRLIRAGFFLQVWKEKCLSSKISGKLSTFDIKTLLDGRTEHEVVDVFSSILEVRRIFNERCSYVDRDIEIIQKYISSDIILAPLS